MGNRLEALQLDRPEALGEVVRGRVGQAASIGTGKEGRAELYFVVNGSPATFYVADLETGGVRFEYNVPDADAVWGMAAAPDGNVYFSGTGGTGRLYRYDPAERVVECVGVHPADPFVWDLASSPDGNIYGATYPHAKVFEYDPNSRRFRDVGPVSDKEHYARGVAATEEYVYGGVGSVAALQRIHRASGVREELHVEGCTGTQGFIDRIWPYGELLFLSIGGREAVVYEPVSQRVVSRFRADNFVSPPSPTDGAFYFVADGNIHSYSTNTHGTTIHTELPNVEDNPKIKCMQWVALKGKPERVLAVVTSNADVVFYDPSTNTAEASRVSLPTKPLLLQSLESDGAGKLYLGGYHRSLTIYDPELDRVEASLPKFPQIEGIGFLNGKVYFGTYTKANIYRYDPSLPLDPSMTAEANPSLAKHIGHGQDRPFSFASGDGKLFIGTTPDYGSLTGALTVYDEAEDRWDVYPNLVPNQSIIGLAYEGGLLYGGTSNWGGLGIEPTETEAKLFVWDAKDRKLIACFTPAIPGIDTAPRMIGELSVGPDGNVWGVVDGTIFAMAPGTQTIVKSKTIFPSEYRYSKFRPYYLRWSADGLLFTMVGRRMVVVDPDTLDHQVLDDRPLSLMTLGTDGHVYYCDESRLMGRKRL
ncbi:hypothetical protein [Paenibacillus sp.]|uniref:hypothetical protein n=1 Tax=Paenibacillus sp. TaxID=58172 RepID=UPI0028122C08|nr:hypothetical protein [Paenibacillus sp.]